MLDKEITDLLTYAETHLMLDELDKARSARRIVGLLKLDGYSPSYAEEDDETAQNIDGMTSPDKLLEPILSYAEEHGVCTADGKVALKADIMDALMLRPSEINDLFNDTASVNKQKAFDFLYDYSVKSGYIVTADRAGVDRWEAKELKSRLEITVNPYAHGKCECNVCADSDGFGEYANRRTVIAEIADGEYEFAFSRCRRLDRCASLVAKDGKANLKKLLHAADFVGSDYYVCQKAQTESEKSGCRFIVGYRQAPELKAGYKARYKSKTYPYIELGTVDWYCTVIRLSHSNLEKVVEFADKLIAAWKSYSDTRISNADGKKNYADVVARKCADKYILDVILRSDGVKKSIPAEFSDMKASALHLPDLLGYIALPEKLSERMQLVLQYLDGTTPFDKNAVPEAAAPVAKMVERMLNEQGGTVSKLEAKLNLHDEIDAACEKVLSAASVFDDESIAKFFETLDIHAI